MINLIVPVYNVEKYLIRCLDSIKKQDYDKFRAIIVDDGSTDGCPFICDSYTKDDERFIVLHKQNGGLSSAIKYGILNSPPCDYYMFVDGDDSLEKDAIKIVSNILKQQMPDILIYDFTKVFDNGESVLISSDIQEGLYKGNSFIFIKNVFQKKIVPARWNKVFKASVVKDIIIDYSEEVSVAEDMLFTTLSLYKSNSLYYKSLSLINYYQNSSSMMHNYKTAYLKSYLSVYDILSHKLENKTLPDKILFQHLKTLIQQLINSNNSEVFKKSEFLSILNNIQVIEVIDRIKMSGIKNRVLRLLMKYKMYFLFKVLTRINRR